MPVRGRRRGGLVWGVWTKVGRWEGREGGGGEGDELAEEVTEAMGDVVEERGLCWGRLGG